MQIIDCDAARHGGAILSIFNEAIVNTTALYDYQPRTPEKMASWFEVKRQGNFPVFVAVNESSEVMGFGSYGSFRPHPAYKYTVEHSVYVDGRFRGQGIGRRLLDEVIARAKLQDFHVLIGVIDSTNAVSIGLHESLGFEPAGTVRQVGYKFGRWLDVCLYQLVLETPVGPMDG